MAKAILMSIRPKHVCNILNLIKLLEIRKKFPSDYVGWVYIYCTKGGDMICYRPNFDGYTCVPNLYGNEYFNGKVVARFWCDKVETIKLPYTYFGTNKWVGGEHERTLQTETMDEETLLKQSCISEEEIYKYLNFKHSPDYCGTAIHITKLEIFDKPKELSEFYNRLAPNFEHLVKYCEKRGEKYARDDYDKYCEKAGYKLTRAPQSWSWIEV